MHNWRPAPIRAFVASSWLVYSCIRDLFVDGQGLRGLRARGLRALRPFAFVLFAGSFATFVIQLAACAPPPQPAPTPPPLATTVILGDGRPSELPEVTARKARITASLTAPPYIVLRDGLDAALAAVQNAVVADPRVQAATSTPGGERLRAEVMSVAAARAGDVPPALTGSCAPGACTRVVIYVYPTNTTLTAFVDRAGTVLDLQALADAQPEIPQDLADLAVRIAIHDPQVAAAFDGLTPDEAMAAMSATKTALEGTSCERSRHLCVAPVFTWGEQGTLWTIVDLTTFRLVAATTWTEQGSSGRRRVYSEATLQDAALAPLCETPQTIERDGWRATYLLTSSDGLELRDVSYEGRPVLASARVVDWHVGYVGGNQQRVGFSDAVGCPVFSAAAVIPYGPPTISDGPAGSFTLAITFRSPDWPQPCNYQYTFAATFGSDGALTLEAGNEGRGCGIDGIYHPVLRLEPVEPTRLESRDGAQLTPLVTEGLAEWPAGTPRGFQLTGPAGPISIMPAWGDAELAYVYWTRAKEAEGQGDLPSIGTCCALDEQQGPEQFIGPGTPEDLAGSPVLWYVPRIRNAERERCWADTMITDGMLVPEVWPCRSGLVITSGGARTP